MLQEMLCKLTTLLSNKKSSRSFMYIENKNSESFSPSLTPTLHLKKNTSSYHSFLTLIDTFVHVLKTFFAYTI